MRKAIFTAGIDQVVTKYDADGPVRKVVLKEATIDTESSIALERLGRETVRVFVIPLQPTIDDLDDLILELQDRRNNARDYIQDVFGSKPKEQQLTIGDLPAADPVLPKLQALINQLPAFPGEVADDDETEPRSA